MNYNKLKLLLFITAAMMASSVAAISDAQFEAIKELGRLNGVVLQCGHIKEMQRIKQALLNSLPQRRALGEAFDIATHEAYMDFIQQQQSCPGESALKPQIDLAIEQLQSLFPQE